MPLPGIPRLQPRRRLAPPRVPAHQRVALPRVPVRRLPLPRVPVLRLALALTLVSLPGWPRPVAGQAAGAYLTPGTPAEVHAEHLVARGVLAPVGALERPFRVRALRRALGAVDSLDLHRTDLRSLRIVRRAIEGPGAASATPDESSAGRVAPPEPPSPETASPETAPPQPWRVDFGAGVGAQSATQARRPLLLPGGDGGAWPLAEVRIAGGTGPVAVQLAPRLEERLIDDPDWPVRSRGDDGGVALRWPAALARAEWRWGALEWGELERNWGPPGVPGLLVSPRGYHRPGIGFALGPEAFRFQWRSALLDPGVDRDTGEAVQRWFSLRRLRWRPSPDLEVAVWEAMITAEANGVDEARANPFGLFSFGRQFGIGDARNTSLGADLMWQASPSLRLEGQILVDDLVVWKSDSNPYPHRLGFTLQARGPVALGPGPLAASTWRAYLTGLSGLALNTFRPEEAFTDEGVGLGRLRPDHLEAAVEGTVPLGAAGSSAGLGTLGVRWRRQGARSFDDPFPDLVRSPATPDLPAWSPEIEQETWALHGGVDWMLGPLTVRGGAQLQRRRFPASGATADWHAAARLEVLWWLGWASLRGES